jgi:hypothetical protein
MYVSRFCHAIARGKTFDEACEMSGLNHLQGRHVLSDSEVERVLLGVNAASYLGAALECGVLTKHDFSAD